jgi:branched-chain amino acid transport system ATP-binding protein
MLKIDRLHIQYGNVQALRGVTLGVEPREMVTLIGANGAGKSTTLRAVSGLIKPSKGGIEFEARRIDGLPPHKILELGIVHIPERRELFPEMTVMENLELGAYRAKGGRSFNEKLRNVYDLFPVIGERKTQFAGTLSGGEQQMLAIGRGIMANPRILLLDEPSLGLAPIVVDLLAKIVKTLHQEGMTIVLVEQNAFMALTLANRGYVFETGRIVMEGPSGELLNNDSVRKAYLGM